MIETKIKARNSPLLTTTCSIVLVYDLEVGTRLRIWPEALEATGAVLATVRLHTHKTRFDAKKLTWLYS